MPEIDIPSDVAEMPFEQAIAELESAVAKMENGNMPIAELMKLFERSRYLSEHCRKMLDSFERKISMLSRDDGKNGEWSDFSPEQDQKNSDLPF